ncbi:MAG TPA: FAD-binding oxidoreductase [Candidatus Baltobacteraceae bacterium]|nr:FAD-binding oxidoreductase [Candidatus Baltobacteraceae bacterium]
MAVTIEEARLVELRALLDRRLIEPHQETYDEARRVWNGMIDRRPALIVRCHGASDVLAALRFARENGLPVAVRGGGHNVAGNAVCDDGIVVDLSPMQGVRVDPQARTARAEGGVTWGRFDRETQAFGLATTGGLISTTGIGGFTLGGGIGWLVRKYGLTCDNLLSADVIALDGSFVKASATENADLFWALRGGGGNFGVATSFEYRLHPVGPIILGGVTFYTADKAPKVLHFFREYVERAPDELTSIVVFVTAPPAPFIPAHLHGAPLVGIAVCYAGPIEQGQSVVAPLKSFEPPDVDLIGPMPYIALQGMLDAMAAPGLQNYWKSETIGPLTDDAIVVLIAKGAGMPSPMTHIDVHHMGGAVAKIDADATAFNQRNARFIVNIVSTWTDAGQNNAQIEWTRGVWEALRPFSTGGAYLNFLGDEGEDRVRAAYGEAKYQRLAAIKRRYDPTNALRFNQNIKPA